MNVNVNVRREEEPPPPYETVVPLPIQDDRDCPLSTPLNGGEVEEVKPASRSRRSIYVSCAICVVTLFLMASALYSFLKIDTIEERVNTNKNTIGMLREELLSLRNQSVLLSERVAVLTRRMHVLEAEQARISSKKLEAVALQKVAKMYGDGGISGGLRWGSSPSSHYYFIPLVACAFFKNTYTYGYIK